MHYSNFSAPNKLSLVQRLEFSCMKQVLCVFVVIPPSEFGQFSLFIAQILWWNQDKIVLIATFFKDNFTFFKVEINIFVEYFYKNRHKIIILQQNFTKKMMWKSTFFKNIFTKINTKSSFHNKILQKSDVEMNIVVFFLKNGIAIAGKM